MAFVFDLVYTGYDYPQTRAVRIKHTIPLSQVASNVGTGYTTAQGIVTDTLSAAQALSLANVYAENLRWDSGTSYAASNDISANTNTRLSIQFSLDGKKQVGTYNVPAPDETLVRGADRRVSNAMVSGLSIVVDVIGSGYIAISDGDVPTAVRDADLITVKGVYAE